jgi:predicted RNase H-like HicB family nuclease
VEKTRLRKSNQREVLYSNYNHYNIGEKLVKKMATTTIQIRNSTRDLLREIAAKGETYDDVIIELAAAYDEFINDLIERYECEKDRAVPMEEVFERIDRELATRSREKARQTR